jgi:hypothetical protein
MVAPQRRTDADLARLADTVRPPSLAGERLLPVADALAPLLARPGLRRGITVAVNDGSVRLGLGLAAEASAAGSWAAAVGLPHLGIVAAAEVGIVLERFPVVPALPPHRWTAVVGALLEAMDIVLAGPPPHLPAGQARRLAAVARERGAVLITVGPGWPHPVDLRLGTVERHWLGLGWGHGHLRACWARVTAVGRDAAAGTAQVGMWLPNEAGRLAPGHDPQDGQRATRPPTTPAHVAARGDRLHPPASAG